MSKPPKFKVCSKPKEPKLRIDRISIKNFRGIISAETEAVGDTIIIAGQNGSGKSCVFDAIRLLKSTYGGYQQNEWQHFFGEFQITTNTGLQDLRGLFNDNAKPILINCEFRLHQRERIYIQENASNLLEETIWQTLLPEAFQYGGYRKALFSNQFRDRKPEVLARVAALLPELTAEIAKPNILAAVVVMPSGEVRITNSTLLNLAFTNYRPKDIGVIDFHGAQRHYGRENVSGVNLSLDQSNQVQSQSSLYNYSNKYNNVKSEMAASYIRQLLAEEAESADGGGPNASLSDALKELFATFFPDKEFVGPRPNKNGGLDFPVRTQGGTEHDLDELSSGEKEILYGYLRIRSSAPRDSIILLDEPELHLNPRLIRGLPEFYRQHLVEALGNQLWLVTHSDALIREAVGKPGFNVFHMLPCGAEGAESSQLRPLNVSGDVDPVLTDLVGDLAAYRPGGKAVLFEGGGDSDFDKTFVGALFAQELRGINLISASNKARVKVLHEVLERAYKNGDLPTKFYAITDADSDSPSDVSNGVTRFEWGVYHVENFLLDEEIISQTLNSVGVSGKFDSSIVLERLAAAARNAFGPILRHRVRAFVNAKIVNAIDLGFNPAAQSVGVELGKAAQRTLANVTEAIGSALTEAEIVAFEESVREEIEASFVDGSWKFQLPGREILKHFLAIEKVGVSYEVFRNLVMNRMAESGIKPANMREVIEKILSS